MLTVIIDARTDPKRLATLLGQLVAGVVEGLVRQVLVVADASELGVAELCEESGAAACQTLDAAGRAALGDWVMVLPARLRFRDGWIASLTAYGADAQRAAMVVGLSEGGLFGRRPIGVLVERGRLLDGRGADLQRLRRDLGWRPVRIG